MTQFVRIIQKVYHHTVVDQQFYSCRLFAALMSAATKKFMPTP
jgi:hypothetical protein